MTDVRTLKAHGNPFGEEYEKGVGATYSLPHDHARLLKDQALVEFVDEAPVAPVKK